MDLDFREEFERRISDYEKKGIEHAEARGQHYQYDKSLKNIHASLTQKFILEGMSVSKAEIWASASPEYKKAIEECAMAGVKAEKLEVQRNAKEFRYEAERSLCSLEKAGRTFNR